MASRSRSSSPSDSSRSTSERLSKAIVHLSRSKASRPRSTCAARVGSVGMGLGRQPTSFYPCCGPRKLDGSVDAEPGACGLGSSWRPIHRSPPKSDRRGGECHGHRERRAKPLRRGCHRRRAGGSGDGLPLGPAQPRLRDPRRCRPRRRCLAKPLGHAPAVHARPLRRPSRHAVPGPTQGISDKGRGGRLPRVVRHEVRAADPQRYAC